MEWARDGAGKESNLEWLLEFLRKEIERRERSTTFKEVTVGQTDKPDHIAKEEKRSKPRIPTVSDLQSSTADTGYGFCGRRHAQRSVGMYSSYPFLNVNSIFLKLSYVSDVCAKGI